MASKLAVLPGSRLSPTFLLHGVLEDIDLIEAVAVVILKKDGDHRAVWSCMKVKDLAWCAAVLEDEARDLRNGEKPESIYKEPA